VHEKPPGRDILGLGPEKSARMPAVYALPGSECTKGHDIIFRAPEPVIMTANELLIVHNHKSEWFYVHER
jgi:hypothetical protein